ncbi:DoxX family protein [Nocardioides marmorisolisilvae]|uniref:Invasion protein n=1 Tax=Nocardioides marmorisolisilvae TaxID=1542737 RepID=A0A3N0DQ58_9ACTN|nr:DoxX family protein [Nocardioides marmorisolisilvae]RNL77576.1 invasion protein [Nocardioides marmorisolisilvae]
MDLTIITAAGVASGFAALGTAKVMKTRLMRARAQHVGFRVERYQLIGGAELIGAAGVLAGLAYTPVGYASATGLLALLAGAALVHIRQGDGPAELAPAALFATGTVCYLVALGVAR